MSANLDPGSFVRIRLQLARIGLMVALAAPAYGCAITFDARSLGTTATMASPATATPPGNEFHLSEKAVFLLWGAVPASAPSLQRSLAGQLVGGATVANLRVGVSSKFTDILITILTAGLVVPRTVTYDGVVVGGH